MNLSVNALAWPLVEGLLQDREVLRVEVSELDNGCQVVDAGINAVGGVEAGRRVAEICMGGLGRVEISTPAGDWPFGLCVQSSQPVLACLASQYAGWTLSEGKFYALGSGPARAMGSKEALFEELAYRDAPGPACMVIESETVPPVELVNGIATRCGIKPEALVLIVTPATSTAGIVQVAARVLEVALHKAHELKFPLAGIVDGMARVPLPPPVPKVVASMGRSNDAIIFAGQVWLMVDCTDEQAGTLAEQLPSSTSRDYGRPFAELFKAVGGDFYKLDPMLFSPAQVQLTNLRTGNTFRAGRVDTTLLATSFGT